MKVGIGFDSHRLVEGRPLVLGGVEIDFPKGLAGHSDGDCLLHALCDALYGALGEGDMGEHFPDTDPQWKDAESSQFLMHAAGLVSDRAMNISNVDTVVIAAEPNLSPHKQVMRERIASILGIAPGQVNIKAKRPEGFETAAEGVIAAQAVVCVG